YEPVSNWLFTVSEELEQRTSAICRRYHIPERSLGISSALSASDFHLLEKLNAKDVLSGDSLTWTAVFVESIISVIIAMACGGSGVVLISEGPVGMLIGFLLSFLVLALSHAMGKKALDEKLMNADLPLPLRRMVLSSPLPKLSLPKLSLSKLNPFREKKEEDLSARRMRSIRNKIFSNYEKLFSESEDPELLALNVRMSRDISAQIEQR
ncbi:MAG: hypothetical protein IJQ02_15305, partial [Oscillospiraceae bacterium]|nr:hypothetical protein [Oscillospiraceae bacterium]